MKRFESARRAFTLVELLAVLVIVGLLAGVAIPRFASAMPRQRLDAAARQLETDLVLAREHARHTGATVSVEINLTTARYHIAEFADPDRVRQEYSIDLGADPYLITELAVTFSRSLAMDEFVSATQREIEFNGYGCPTGNATDGVRIKLGDGADIRTIEIAPFSGEVTIE